MATGDGVNNTFDFWFLKKKLCRPRAPNNPITYFLHRRCPCSKHFDMATHPNNANAQQQQAAAAAAAAATRAASIEFIVTPREDLFLGGGERTLCRVKKGEQYPCQMQKNQNFSCLFRHYAKHNGLKKEDLVFYFVDELGPDQTPETAHLMPQDEIVVEHRVKSVTKVEEKPEVSSAVFGQQLRSLLRKGTFADVMFVVGEERERFGAHKAVLSARSEYFEAMFTPVISAGDNHSSNSNSNSASSSSSSSSKGGSAVVACSSSSSSSSGPVPTEIELLSHDKDAFRRMLEFVYAGDVEDLEEASSTDMIALLNLAEQYCLTDLGKLCEHAAAKIINFSSIGKFMLVSARYDLPQLKRACQEYVSEHKRELRADVNFRREIEENPELGLLILDASAGDDGQGASKRRRITGPEHDFVAHSDSNTIGATGGDHA